MNVTQTYKPETLLVLRDGYIDDEYYDQLYVDKRREALREAGKSAVKGTMRTAVSVSKHIVELLREVPEHVNQY